MTEQAWAVEQVNKRGNHFFEMLNQKKTFHEDPSTLTKILLMCTKSWWPLRALN